jgi:hypothetical protein
MIREDPSVSEVWLGYVAYRNLCRAIGMGDVSHMQGVPLRCRSSMADALTVVFYEQSAAPGRSAVASDGPPPFGVQFPSREIAIGSLWKRRSREWGRDQVCRVLSSANEHHVTFRVVTPPDETRPALTASLENFHVYWTPDVQLRDCPRAWTIWQHLETDQVVQVMPGTPTQIANNQVAYFTPDGRRETTPVVTFHRLYRELPAPPTGHIWCRDDCLFTVELHDGEATAHPYTVHEESRQAISSALGCAAFYATYKPLTFEDELVVLYPEALVQRDARWGSKADPNYSAFIIDIGRVSDGADYVRFNNDAGLHVMELRKFLSEFELPPQPIPCEVGETWVDLVDPKRQGVIAKVDPARGQVVMHWDARAETTYSVEALLHQFRKLDVRSYWEILDSEDEP